MLYVYLHAPVAPEAVAVSATVPFVATVVLLAANLTASVCFLTVTFTLDEAVAPFESVTTTETVLEPIAPVFHLYTFDV